MSASKPHSPHFNKNSSDDHHFKLLRERVKLALDTLPPSRLGVSRAKAFFLPAIYFGVYIVALFQTNFVYFCAAYILLGFMLIILFLNLIHEASHHTLFKRKSNNEIFMLLFDIIGANSYMWNKRHLRLHHNFPNVDGWDSDIEKSRFLKVHPQAGIKKGHRYQHLIIFMYPLFITNWFLVRDFKDFFNPNMIVRKIAEVPLIEYFKLFFFKFLFIGYLVVVPVLLTPFSLAQTFLALFIMLVTAGMFALTVLLPPHVNTENQFPITNDQLDLSQCWLSHQLNTTNDVGRSTWFTRHVMANSNFHISHHLFPNISYVYAREVTDIIKKYNLQAGLPYRSYPMATTFRNHYKLIKGNARLINILEEDM
jgi:linoleoyl-CoA desaturase